MAVSVRSLSLRPVRRGIYLYFRLLGQQMKSILAYQADFVILIFAAALTQIAGFIFIWTVFQRIPDINGWTFWQVVTMYSLIFITEGVGSLFFEGTWWLGYLVWSGDFDKMLVRPVSPIIQVLSSKVGFNGAGNIVTGFTLMGIAIANVPVHWTPGRALMLVILVISASTIRVALNLATASTGFFFRNPWSMVSMFVHQLGELAKYPITIYAVAIQALVVVVVPFAFVSFFPTAYIFEVDAFSPAGLLTPLVAVYCVVMAVLIFRRGLRSYESSGH
jgi:ABC-2 type transport system permease protein